MPKVQDLKAYYRDIITKAGLDDERAKQVLGLMDDEKFAKAFTEGFKPLPDYSHDLDDVRAKTKAEKDKEYQAWYEKEVAVYEANLAGIKKLEAYEAKYGPLDADQQQQFLKDQNRGGSAMTKEDIDKMMAAWKAETEAQFARRDKATLDYIEVRESHLATFKKPLDVKAFEEQWKAHPEWGDLKQAYKEFVTPEMEKVQKAQFDDELKRKYEEGVRDGFSRKAVPSDSRPTSFSPLFDRDTNIDKMSEAEAEKHSRAAFFEGLTEKQPA